MVRKFITSSTNKPTKRFDHDLHLCRVLIEAEDRALYFAAVSCRNGLFFKRMLLVQPLHGNPCAVVFDADNLPKATMLFMARAMNLS